MAANSDSPRLPGDKSLTHRALILGALATGTSVIRQPLAAADTRSTAAVLRALGVDLDWAGEEVRVVGRGLLGLRPPSGILDCGNSGTTARLLLGLLAPQPLSATLTGDDSLRRRPMRRVITPLRRMGAQLRELEAPDRLPVEVSGAALRSAEYHSPQASAQVKSALLLAGLAAGVPVAVTEPFLSRDHTERMLSGLGVPLRAGPDPVGYRVELTPVTQLPPLDIDIPADFSAAAFLIAAGLLSTGELRLARVGVNPTRTGLLTVLRRMGAEIELRAERESGGEPVADLHVRPSVLRGTEVGAAELPALIDEVPILAALAARAEGETRITGASELRVKESDRIALMVGNLRALGAAAEELADGLVVQGTTSPLQGRIRTAGDHRIAMAFGVLGRAPGCRIEIDDPDAVGVSFPGFWEELARLGPRP